MILRLLMMPSPYLAITCSERAAMASLFGYGSDDIGDVSYSYARLLALAPEFDENPWLIDECVRRGITVSAAHTTANYEQIQNAVENGITHRSHWAIVNLVRLARR